jgi:hypothetical protein
MTEQREHENVPAFAVLGHPNKGKSSLVAALAQDERVRIAPDPGTTTRANRYPLRVDGETLYVLVDTPGFQRARGVLAWLQAEAERSDGTAADRPALVAKFCETPGHRERFPDEVALLEPVIEGAGVLYVVDGAVPFSRDYEAEMEILRWTGRPSLAVINSIGEPTYVEEWENALGQFFRVVRVLDAMHASFETRLDMLRAFGELDPRWREALQRAVAALEGQRARKNREAASVVAALLASATSLCVEQRIPEGADPADYRAGLEERYRSGLRTLEFDARRAVESVYDWSQLAYSEGGEETAEPESALLDEDLFSERTWLVFGMRMRDLVTAGGAAGAATGGVIDAATGGASLLAGAAIGGVIGGALGFLGAGRLADTKILQRPLGGRLLVYGPARSPNLVAVLLGRARLHHAVVSGRTHARRDLLDLAAEGARIGGSLQALDASGLRRLTQLLGGSSPEELEREVEKLLQDDAVRAGETSPPRGG